MGSFKFRKIFMAQTCKVGENCAAIKIELSKTCLPWDSKTASTPLSFTRAGKFSVVVRPRKYTGQGKQVEEYATGQFELKR